jgi:hypothetical protein
LCFKHAALRKAIQLRTSVKNFRLLSKSGNYQPNVVYHVLAKVWRIIAFFHGSTFAASLSKSKAELLDIPHLKLKIDVVTRWNSAYHDMT